MSTPDSAAAGPRGVRPANAPGERLTSPDPAHRDDTPDADGPNDALAIQAVSVHYGGVCAVDQLSISMRPGLLYGLAGPNGSGKSTLLGAISRFVKISGGRILFEGRDCTTKSPTEMARTGLGRTFQTVRLMPALTVLENVMLGGDLRLRDMALRERLNIRARGFRPSRAHEHECRELARECLARVGLQDVASARPAELPYGVQRRVEIARALATRPHVLLLDEPTAGMSRAERQDVTRLLQSLRADGLTQVLVEHDVGMLLELTDHLYVMNTGRLIAEGQPETVVQLPVVQNAYLGVAGA
jgi:branched-chain amino acid transport system ATP-binding protein